MHNSSVRLIHALQTCTRCAPCLSAQFFVLVRQVRVRVARLPRSALLIRCVALLRLPRVDLIWVAWNLKWLFDIAVEERKGLLGSSAWFEPSKYMYVQGRSVRMFM